VVKQKNTPTLILLARLFATKTFKGFLTRNKEQMSIPTLAEHLAELSAQKGVKPRDAVKAANMYLVYGMEIFSGKRTNPSRDYLIRLAFGLGLDYDECQKLLAVAGKNALYPRVPRDALIIKCLYNKMSLRETEEMLDEMGMATLGGID
jgi:cyanate lyase